MTGGVPLGGAIDLSSLAKPVQQEPALPEGMYICSVPNGCSLVMRIREDGVMHQTQTDCIRTALPYVEGYLEYEEQFLALVPAVQKLKDQNTSFLTANTRLADDLDKAKGEIARLKRVQSEHANCPTPE